MQRQDYSSDDEPLVDLTATIPLRSKRTDRMRRKKAMRDEKQNAKPSLANLPTELILEITKLLLPSAVYSFSFVNSRFQSLVRQHRNVIGDDIIRRRYNILAQCFPLPKLLSTVEPSIQARLTDPKRQQQLSIHHNPYQHVRPPDPRLLCTCLTCILTWNNLGLALDFARWQDNLDGGEPIPMIPRGQTTEWNEELLTRNADIVRAALGSSLAYARILETHLSSTVRSIKRQQANKGNKRRHVEMTVEEATSEDDGFLEKPGPLSLEFPFNRDQYYMLEAYLPNRWWKKTEQRWVSSIAGHHERDLEFLVKGTRFLR